MFTAKDEIKATLRGITVKRFLKIKQHLQARRIKKERAELQAVLMLGGIRRVK